MQKCSYVNPIINTEIFLRFSAIKAKQFRKQNGFGRWLAEYERMEKSGLFTPIKLREQYIQIINNNYRFGFIYSQAIQYICSNTIDSINILVLNKTFCIKTIYGDIAIDENDDELSGLLLEDALNICNRMNEEAEEILFKIYCDNILIN